MFGNIEGGSADRERIIRGTGDIQLTPEVCDVAIDTLQRAETIQGGLKPTEQKALETLAIQTGMTGLSETDKLKLMGLKGRIKPLTEAERKDLDDIYSKLNK